MFFPNKPIYLNEPKKKRGGYRFFQAGFFILLITLCFTAYKNYDYWTFKLLIAGNYVFEETLEELYADVIGEGGRGYGKDFDKMVMASFTRHLRSLNGDRYTYLYTPQGYKDSKDAEKADAKLAEFYGLDGETAYLYIPNVNKDTRKFVAANKHELRNYSNLVFDLRGNYGGMLRDFYKIADLFLEKGAVIGHEKARLGIFTKDIKSKGNAFFEFENIVILQDGRTASAAEGLILSLAEYLPNVTLVGETTFGKGIGQVTLPLTGGYAIRGTVLLLKGPNGESIHAVGIDPDVYFEGDFDAAVGEALKIIYS